MQEVRKCKDFPDFLRFGKFVLATFRQLFFCIKPSKMKQNQGKFNGFSQYNSNNFLAWENRFRSFALRREAL